MSAGYLLDFTMRLGKRKIQVQIGVNKVVESLNSNLIKVYCEDERF
jgi:hypothetical protein